MNTENVETINQFLWAVVTVIRSIAWPLVVGFLGWFNRAAIGRVVESLAERVLTVKAPGFEATVGATNKQEGNPGKSLIEAPIASPALPPPSAAIAQLEQELRNQLVGDVNQQNAALLRALAETRMTGGHEWIYNRIYGSQIIALRSLDQRGSATVDEAKQYYDSLIPQHPAMYPGYPFDKWLGFLTGAGLVRQEGNLLHTTAYGHDFLTYLAANSLSDAKAW